MKKILLMCICFAITGVGYAQTKKISAGIKAGLNISTLTNAHDAKSKAGLYGGVFMESRISRIFAFSPELLYSCQGTKFDGVDGRGTIVAHAVNLPLLAKFYPFKTDIVSFEVGPQLGYVASMKFKLGEVSVNAPKSMYNAFDLSVCYGVALNFDKFLLSARYNLGLTNVLKNVDSDNKNSVFQLGAGFRF